MQFKLVHWRLGVNGWASLGSGVGKSTSLRTLCIHGTNVGFIDKSGNCEHMQKLLKGMEQNQSLETLNLSDNDLRDDVKDARDPGHYLLEFIKKIANNRDQQAWEKSLR